MPSGMKVQRVAPPIPNITFGVVALTIIARGAPFRPFFACCGHEVTTRMVIQASLHSRWQSRRILILVTCTNLRLK
jgi:hypothetical protein